MNYKPFTTNNTKDIIKEIKDNLPNIKKSVIAIDTLDLCHLLGEIERLNNIIKIMEKWLEDKDKNALQDDNYWEVLDKLKELRKIYE